MPVCDCCKKEIEKVGLAGMLEQEGVCLPTASDRAVELMREHCLAVINDTQISKNDGHVDVLFNHLKARIEAVR